MTCSKKVQRQRIFVTCIKPVRDFYYRRSHTHTHTHAYVYTIRLRERETGSSSTIANSTVVKNIMHVAVAKCLYDSSCVCASAREAFTSEHRKCCQLQWARRTCCVISNPSVRTNRYSTWCSGRANIICCNVNTSTCALCKSC